MKCSFCDNQTNMTVRNSNDKLFNCCKDCYKASRVGKEGQKKEGLNVSCIFKGHNEITASN